LPFFDEYLALLQKKKKKVQVKNRRRSCWSITYHPGLAAEDKTEMLCEHIADSMVVHHYLQDDSNPSGL
jgi:hypothetical protein